MMQNTLHPIYKFQHVSCRRRELEFIEHMLHAKDILVLKLKMARRCKVLER